MDARTMAFELLKEGKAEEAVKAFHEAVTQDPSSEALRQGLGEALAATKRYDHALNELEYARQMREQNGTLTGRLFANIGHVLNELDRIDESLEAFERAIEIEPKNAGIWKNLAQIHSGRNHFELANDALEKAIELDPDYGNLWLIKAEIRLAAAEIEENIYAYQQAHEKSDILIVLGSESFLEEALEALQKAVELDPFLERAIRLEGECLYNLRRYAPAAEAFTRYLDQPISVKEEAEALTHRANSLMELDRFAEARRDYEKALKIKPDHEWIEHKFSEFKIQERVHQVENQVHEQEKEGYYDNLFDRLMETPRIEVAPMEAPYLQTIIREPTTEPADQPSPERMQELRSVRMANDAMTLKGEGNLEAAYTLGLEALEVSPNAEAHSMVGELEFAWGNYQAALDQFDSALKINEDLVAAMYNRGHCLTKLGHFRQARTVYKKAMRRAQRKGLPLPFKTDRSQSERKTFVHLTTKTKRQRVSGDRRRTLVRSKARRRRETPRSGTTLIVDTDPWR